MSLRLSAEDYTVAWFAPLHFEASAGILMLDEHHQSPLPNEGQRLCYRFGRMGRTNVAIAFFPAGEIGIGVASYMASEIQRDLRNIKRGLLVGICAGIPRYGHDMRLGDVVVVTPADHNSGVYGYDMIKVEPEQIIPKQWQNAPDRHIRSAINGLRASRETTTRFRSNLDRFRSINVSQRPVPPANVLCGSFTQPREPIIHYGSILSGNSVIKSAKRRDELAREYNAFAIEMEAAGMMNTLSVAVIRGISDWADGEKNDVWQEYAAATAAAVAKELLAFLDGSHSISHQSQIWDRPRMNRAQLNVLLAQKAAQYAQPNLDWQNSVVDLLKILNLDSSREARMRLAQRWNILIGEDGSASRNVSLHRTITERLAANNGIVPDSLVRGLSVAGYAR
ncbi:nucleoside phosphorylase domain-containing protein [Aspergillus bertholletiae]|uniref:Nucleoside phosphorylase domain-containing protein n=1 Tax=Aspergillus bertholletiae TaxID=1226010 RepID=A0A5N7APZ5_9EURO|nr:nucleoside phosphorylase domain-containing protein [Aspergillus bertholletiae]